MTKKSLDDRIAEASGRLSPAEKRVALFFQKNREEVMISAAAAIARRANTSDATVVRASQALGYAGLDDLRRGLAAEMTGGTSLSSRVSRTVKELGDEPNEAFQKTLDVLLDALVTLRGQTNQRDFRRVVELLAASTRIAVFGIGPSSAIAQYFAVQLGRFGCQTLSVGRTGLLFADDLHALRTGDVVVVLAYDRIYGEIELLLTETKRLKIPTVLITDSLKAKLQGRVTLTLPVPRGRADLLSMHTATLALLEALLVGIAGQASRQIVASLDRLNTLREALAGKALTLPTPHA